MEFQEGEEELGGLHIGAGGGGDAVGVVVGEDHAGGIGGDGKLHEAALGDGAGVDAALEQELPADNLVLLSKNRA